MSEPVIEVIRLCLICAKPRDRELPDPIPEGYEVMWSEGMLGKALYCQSCFDSFEISDV